MSHLIEFAKLLIETVLVDKMSEELFFSADVETDGPIPGAYSMLSFGVVALTKDGKELGSFSANLETAPGAEQDPDTMNWWATQPQAWTACRKDLQEPVKAMTDFVNWVDQLCGDKYIPVMVCMPAGFDFMFMYWYLRKFTSRSPFSFSCIDMKTYAMATLGKEYRQSSKRSWPKQWFPKNVNHTHIAVEDAREQGLTFINMLKANSK